MYIKRLAPTFETSFLVSRLLYEEHIYKSQEDCMHDVFGVHAFLSEIENGSRLVWGAFRKEDDFFLGAAHGSFEGENFVGHVLFKRKVDATALCLKIEEDIKAYCKENNIVCRAIVGYPPEHLRASVIMIKRFGCKDLGRAENVDFYVNGKNMPCRYMRKELNYV